MSEASQMVDEGSSLTDTCAGQHVHVPERSKRLPAKSESIHACLQMCPRKSQRKHFWKSRLADQLFLHVNLTYVLARYKHLDSSMEVIACGKAAKAMHMQKRAMLQLK